MSMSHKIGSHSHNNFLFFVSIQKVSG
jgi:hypothetical protein